MPPWARPHGRGHRGGPPLRFIWIWVLVVIAIIIITWHGHPGPNPNRPPIPLIILGAATLITAYVTLRFTRRLHRLRLAVEQINLRDLTVRVPMGGRDSVASLAQSFNGMVDRLDAQERVRRQFFADLTHEIRHPIAILLGRLESIQDGVLPLDPEQILHLHDMALGLKRIVTDMNDLSLADVGQLSLHLEPVDLNGLAEQLHANLEPVAQDLQISLTSQVDPTVPHVTADADRLRQVLTNLITNALHHTPSGGTVSLTISTHERDVVIEVADTGSGIAPDDLPHLFERFYRAGRARSRARGGSGLGLSIVRSLVDLHGGSIHVVSQLGEGSQFTVRLPRNGPTGQST